MPEETPEQPTQPQPMESEEETEGLIGGAETPWAFIILGSVIAVAVTMLVVFRKKAKNGLARLRGHKTETPMKTHRQKTQVKDWIPKT